MPVRVLHLTERAGFDICPICFWEDDGQDSDDAAIVRGGPNHDYSLIEARANFKNHHTMYRPSDIAHFKRENAKISLKKAMYDAHIKAIATNTIEDWSAALSEEERYHNESS